MKGIEVSMTNLRQLLQRLRLKQSIRGIHSEMGTHRTIIRKIYDIAVQKEWLNPDTAMPSDEEINDVWSGDKVKKEEHILDSHREKIKEWHEADNTTVVIQRLLAEMLEVRVDVQVIRRYIHKYFPKEIKAVMVRSTTPGKDADVDFGDLGVFEDDDGNHRKVYLISIRLRHSRKAYRELILDQASFTFNQVHVHAFEFFKGVISYMHPDCTKCAVIRASIENDGLNKSY